MQKRKFFFIILEMFLLLLFLLGYAEPWEDAQLLNQNGYWEVKKEGITLKWKIDGPLLRVILAAPTKGWIAVGFDPSELMMEANLILGYVKDDKVIIRDDYGIWYTSHASDESLGGSNDVTNIDGTEGENETKISFTIPLDSGDQYDRPLKPGHTYLILLSYGEDDNFSIQHKKRTKIEIKL